jgi:hypothetical protein
MKKLKSERVSSLHHLKDDEFFRGAIYCKKLLEKSNEFYEDEFFSIAFFIFDGDERETTEAIKMTKQRCLEEYFERRKN